MSQVKRYTVKAKDGLQLDCGHTLKAGETLVVTSVYTCEKEQHWPLTILLACLQVLSRNQTATQPGSGTISATTRNVYAYRSQSKPTS